MKMRILVVLSSLIVLMSCSSSENYSLDPGIPRVETPSDQIAYVRTKWVNEKHVETAFFDSQDRLLEVFRFGVSSKKTRQLYDGTINTMTVHFAHSDSSPMGSVSVDTLRRTFDKGGRLVIESWTNGFISKEGVWGLTGHSERYLSYTPKGDTLVRRAKNSDDATNSSTVVNIDRWEKDKQQRLRRHYRLFVMRMPDNPHDTVYHYSQLYAYDSDGKLAMSWFDHMYLGRSYSPSGADTIGYIYDSKNRLVAERHRYTTDMSNKSEPDTAGRDDFEKESIERDRRKFFVGDAMYPHYNRVTWVEYRYEPFDSTKHLPLHIPYYLDNL